MTRHWSNIYILFGSSTADLGDITAERPLPQQQNFLCSFWENLIKSYPVIVYELN